MGAVEEVFSEEAARHVGTSAERFTGHTEWNLLDCAERSGMAGSAGEIRTVADSVQAVRRVAEKRPDRENLP